MTRRRRVQVLECCVFDDTRAPPPAPSHSAPPGAADGDCSATVCPNCDDDGLTDAEDDRVSRPRRRSCEITLTCTGWGGRLGVLGGGATCAIKQRGAATSRRSRCDARRLCPLSAGAWSNHSAASEDPRLSSSPRLVASFTLSTAFVLNPLAHFSSLTKYILRRVATLGNREFNRLFFSFFLSLCLLVEAND